MVFIGSTGGVDRSANIQAGLYCHVPLSFDERVLINFHSFFTAVVCAFSRERKRLQEQQKLLQEGLTTKSKVSELAVHVEQTFGYVQRRLKERAGTIWSILKCVAHAEESCSFLSWTSVFDR